MYEMKTAGMSASPNSYASEDYSSMKEYKNSIYEKIGEYAKNSKGKGDMIWVSISEECFVAMRQNPAYESWVLNKIRNAYASCKKDGYDNWTFLKFGANEAEYKEEVHIRPDSRMQKKIREREQEEKRAMEQKRKKQLEKKLLEEKWRKQKAERTFVQLRILDHREQTEEENKAIRFHKDFSPKDHRASLYAKAKRKVLAYESTFRYQDNLQP